MGAPMEHRGAYTAVKPELVRVEVSAVEEGLPFTVWIGYVIVRRFSDRDNAEELARSIRAELEVEFKSRARNVARESSPRFREVKHY